MKNLTPLMMTARLGALALQAVKNAPYCQIQTAAGLKALLMASANAAGDCQQSSAWEVLPEVCSVQRNI